MLIKNIKHVLFIVLIFSVLFPLKFAQNFDEYTINSNDYIICAETRVTEYDWVRYKKSNKTNFDTSVFNPADYDVEYFNFVDKTPKDGKYNLELSNIYIVYGEKIESGEEDEFYKNKVYTCDDWEVLYPIKRHNTIEFLLPRRYLCLVDIIAKHNTLLSVIIELSYLLVVIIFVVKISFKFLQNIWDRFGPVPKK